MNKVIAEYFGTQFELTLTEQSETYYKGFLKWDEENKKRYFDASKIHEEEDDSWYLDDNGDRLQDKELFEKSPWTIIENGKTRKVVQRFMNGNGETWFAMEPWFRIGDEYNKK
jgi:hypothetical protein